MTSLLRISQALDSGDIGRVLLALESFDDSIDKSKCHESFKKFLDELLTWDHASNPELSENVLQQLFSLVTDQKDLEEICKRVLKSQTPVAVQIAVQIMIQNEWKLSQQECNEIWEKGKKTEELKSLTARTSKEYATRAAAICRILRASGTPNRFLRKLLASQLKPLNGQKKLPMEFLVELSVCVPFHPLLVLENFKTDSDVCLIPLVYTHSFTVEQEVAEFTQYLQPDGGYQKESAVSMLKVFFGLCKATNFTLGATDIDRTVDFWLAAFQIFNGHGIVIQNVYETGQNFEKMTNCFEMSRRPLFLKHFLRKFIDKKDSDINLEPQIIGLTIGIFQRNAFGNESPEFYEELGDFWTLVHQMVYGDIYGSTCYFSSVFALALAQATFKVKKALCRNVYETILKPMYQRIVDFTKLKNVESEKATTESQKMMLQQSNFGSETFNLLICNYKLAEESILKFINDD